MSIPFRDWSHPIEAQLQDQGEDDLNGPGGWRGRHRAGPYCWRCRPMLNVIANGDISADLTRRPLVGKL
jgi:hypothetical protein